MSELQYPGNYSGAEEVVAAAAPQTLTAAWVDLGGELVVGGSNVVVLWLNVDINDSLNVMVRALAKHEAAGADEYVFPIKAESTSIVRVEDNEVELVNDVDQKIIIGFGLESAVLVVQFQVMVGTLGASAGIILSALATTGR